MAHTSHAKTKSMIRKEEVYKIGRITKLHGIKGEVVLNFTDDVFDRVECD